MIRIELNTRRGKVLFPLAALMVALPYLYWVQNHYRAANAAETLSSQGLEEATRLEPASAEYNDMLGRFYLFANQDTGKSITALRRATELDSHSSRYWLDLANAESLAANPTAQRKALQNAIEVDPKTPSVAWEAGNFFLLDGKTDAALKSFKTVIEYDPIGSRSALDLSWRATRSVEKILTCAMPAKYEPHLQLLQLLIEKQQTEAAMTTWRAMVALNQPIRASDVLPFSEYLLVHHEVGAAVEAWKTIEKLSSSLRPATSDGNLIVNGNFEEEIIPGGFSWHLDPPASKSLQVDDREIHSGTASVSLTFEGPTFSDYGLWQWVAVTPNQMYEFRFTTKSQEIISANGPRILIEDAFSHARLATSAEILGTHGWSEEQLLFSTKPDTHLIRVYVGRVPAEGLVRGRLWLDDIRMYER